MPLQFLEKNNASFDISKLPNLFLASNICSTHQPNEAIAETLVLFGFLRLARQVSNTTTWARRTRLYELQDEFWLERSCIRRIRRGLLPVVGCNLAKQGKPILTLNVRRAANKRSKNADKKARFCSVCREHALATKTKAGVCSLGYGPFCRFPHCHRLLPSLI